MENYYFKVVCIDDTNPLEFMVIEDKNLGTLDDVHNFISERILQNDPTRAKWILLPMQKML